MTVDLTSNEQRIWFLNPFRDGRKVLYLVAQELLATKVLEPQQRGVPAVEKLVLTNIAKNRVTVLADRFFFGEGLLKRLDCDSEKTPVSLIDSFELTEAGMRVPGIEPPPPPKREEPKSAKRTSSKPSNVRELF